jgi:hypothetical protein
LKDESAVGGSPRSLTVLPAFGLQARKSVQLLIPAEAVRLDFAKEGAGSKQVSESNADGNDDAIAHLTSKWES